jgi:hypothetical protein
MTLPAAQLWFGKTVHSIFLCSYHAYNRCDGAGVVPTRLAAQLKRDGRGPVGAAAYARMGNSSTTFRSYSRS